MAPQTFAVPLDVDDVFGSEARARAGSLAKQFQSVWRKRMERLAAKLNARVTDHKIAVRYHFWIEEGEDHYWVRFPDFPKAHISAAKDVSIEDTINKYFIDLVSLTISKNAKGPESASLLPVPARRRSRGKKVYHTVELEMPTDEAVVLYGLDN